ncbi:MFS transporter [Iodobacter fluviatilis]|nr:MFS transporter [Iodobacter fluviatilis]
MNTSLSDKDARRNFKYMWLGQFISQFGSQITSIVLIFWLKEQVGLASVMGLSAMLFSLFIAIFSPLGGALADIYCRKTIIISSDLLAGTASILLPLAFYFFPDQLYLLITLVLLMQLVLGAVLGLYDPAYSALLSNVVAKEQLPLANSIKNATIQGAVLIGQGIGLLLYSQFGIISILIANSLSFYLSALSESRIKLPQQEAKPVKATHTLSDSKKIIAGMKQGLMYISEKKSLKSLLLLIGGINFLIGPFVILLPFYVEQILSVPDYWYGYLIAAFGGGGLIGYLSLPFFKSRVQDWSALGRNSYLFFGFLLISLGVSKNIYLSLILFIACGSCFGLINTMIETAILTNTPDDKRGRVMSIYRVITRLSLPLGMVISGGLVDFYHFTIENIFIACGIAVLILSIQQFIQQKLKEVLAL